MNVEDQELTDEEIDQALRGNRLLIGIVPTDSQQAQVRQRRGQARIRKLTVANYGARCAVCDVTDHAFLVASHVIGWAEAPEHRGDLANIICLCRIRDALFETGYWSLGDSLSLLKRKNVASITIRQLLNE
jgi:predicted restriction endonuclease